MVALLYVSVSELAVADAASEIDGIVQNASIKNARLAVTGALVFTGVHFAQALEGPKANVQALMEQIRLDERHSRVTVVHEVPIAKRRFERWGMGYSGRSTFVERTLQQALALPEGRDRDEVVGRIYEFMSEFQRS